MCIDNIVDNMLKGLNKQVGVMICNIVDLFLSISFIFFLLPIYGVYGYIAILYISEFLNLSVSIFQLHSVSNFKFKLREWFLKPLIALGISTVFVNLIISKNSFSIFTLILEILVFVLRLYYKFTFYKWNYKRGFGFLNFFHILIQLWCSFGRCTMSTINQLFYFIDCSLIKPFF